MSELALQLIAENKRARSPVLDLGNCGLTEVPAEIGELVWLEELSFASDLIVSEEGGEENQNRGESNQLCILAGHRNSQTENEGNPNQSNPFVGLIKLKSLFLNAQYNKRSSFTDLSSLAVLNNLEQLDISYSQVTDLAPLSVLANLKILRISNMAITDLSPLSGLVNLQEILVSNTAVTDLLPFSGLSNLQVLSISDTPVTDLSPLSGLTNLKALDVSNTNVIDLSLLSNLINLEAFLVSNTNVADLSPMSGLIQLHTLNIWATSVIDLSPISGLVNLQMLNVWDTKVKDLSALSGLTNLKILDITGTLVTDLSPLSRLGNLQSLIISDTQISNLSPVLELIKIGLPVKWSSKTWEYDGIYIENCPLSNPPTEIAQQGNEAILNYFNEQQRQGTAKLYEAKMLLIGEGGAGKTSLLRRLFQTERTELPEEQETTKGIAIHHHTFKTSDQHDFHLNVWDFGGQEIYHATHQFFLTKRSLYVLLDDTRKNDKSVHDPSFKYWLEVADLLGNHSPVLIFQNEKGDRSKTIDESGIKGKFPNVKEIYKGNLARTDAADGIRKGVEYFAQNLPHIGEDLPARWVDIRAELEWQSHTRPYISLDDYFGIYKQFLDFDRTKALHLSRYLHDLGVFLHFQDEPLLAKTLILQNTWATEAVFKMLDDETVKAQLGRFDDGDCQRVWQASAYADMHPELLALMQKFELCFLLPDKPNKHWLVPQLLPPSKPVDLTDWQQAGDLCLRFLYEFLPKGIISRLIVRMHRFVQNPECSWISGALFERDGTQLLAEVPAKGGEILLRARGPERKELLSVIVSDLDAMNEGFHGLNDLVSKLIPCQCSSCIKSSEPEFFKYERLLQRKRDAKLKVECPSSYEEVNVLGLLEGISNDDKFSKSKMFASINVFVDGFDKSIEGNLKKYLIGLGVNVVDSQEEINLYIIEINTDSYKSKGGGKTLLYCDDEINFERLVETKEVVLRYRRNALISFFESIETWILLNFEY